MRYVLLVCGDENQALSEQQRQERLEAFMAFQATLETRGSLVGLQRLRPTSSATTVKVRDGGLVIASMSAAAVMMPPVSDCPVWTARRLSRVWTHSSRIRLTNAVLKRPGGEQLDASGHVGVVDRRRAGAETQKYSRYSSCAK